MHLAELKALRRSGVKKPSAHCSGQPSSNVTYIYIYTFFFLNSLSISLLEERSTEPGLRNAALVYKAPTHSFAHLIFGTGRYVYPDYSDEESAAHRGLVTCSESPNQLKVEPYSNPGPSRMPSVVWNVWKAGHWRRGKTWQGSNSTRRHLGEATRLKSSQKVLPEDQHGDTGLWVKERVGTVNWVTSAGESAFKLSQIEIRITRTAWSRDEIIF